MLKDIKILQENLEKAIKLNIDDRKLFERISKEAKGKFRNGVISDLFNEMISFYTLSESKCYFLANSLIESLSEPQLKKIENEKIDINVSHFFTDKEINQINIDSLDISNVRNNNIIELNSMRVIDEGEHWSGEKTLEEWADLLNENYFLYKAGELQREGIKKELGGKIITSPFVNYKNVEEIIDAMLNDNYIADTITIACIRTNDMEEAKFISINKESERNLKKEMEKGVYPYNDIMLEISPKCPIYLLDGMHRSISIQQVVAEARRKNKTDILNKVIKIDYAYWSFEKASSFVYQMQQGTKMPKRYVKTLNVGNNSMNMAKELNKEGNEKTNELYNRLVTNALELKYDGYCLMSTFADSVNMAFGDLIEKPRHYSKTRQYLKTFYNELLGVFKDKYEVDNLKELKDLAIMENNMFIFYNGIAKELYKDGIAKDELGDLLELLANEINWSKDNKEWDDNGIFASGVSKAGISKILKLSADIAKDVM